MNGITALVTVNVLGLSSYLFSSFLFLHRHVQVNGAELIFGGTVFPPGFVLKVAPMVWCSLFVWRVGNRVVWETHEP